MYKYFSPFKSKKNLQACNNDVYFNFLVRCTSLTIREVSSFRKSSSVKSNKNPSHRTSSPTTAYKPTDVEAKRFKWWEEKGHFLPNDATETFTMILPPPNVTGVLHLGHALTATVQDVSARWHRMQGHSVLWVPGLDHAGIATQVIVEKNLWQKRTLTRHDIGRDRFVEEIWKWKHEKGQHITEQLKSLGASMDWSRELFTMNPKQSIAVKEAFIRLYNSGLIYRSLSLVNWSCTLQSAISDIEVDLKEIKGSTMLSVPGYEKPVEFGVLHNFAYKLLDQDGEIVVSTTRIETMLGDVAIAVHPDDIKYKHLHGAFAIHPFTGIKIPIIADSFVDPAFGTGAVKITPAHDQTDFEVGKRNNLRPVSVFNEEGRVILKLGKFYLLKRFDARATVLAELQQLGLLRGRQDHATNVPICSRSGDVVEMLLKPQWFVRCGKMAEAASAAVRDGALVIEPKDFEKTWFRWLHGIRDWCVSRQLWWGHRVPMYECRSPGAAAGDGMWVAARDEAEARALAARQLGLGAAEAALLLVEQDADVLDTWFSAGLLPISAFDWPNQSAGLERFYPISQLITGHDILFFWVARMVMLCTELTGKLPFNKIFLHGIICDAQGKKMSKSLGNVIYPENVIKGLSLEELHTQVKNSFDEGLMTKADFDRTLDKHTKSYPNGIPECGTDALRFTLCSHNIKNHFINFDVAECRTNRLFCNKVWQAHKFVRLASKRHHAMCAPLPLPSHPAFSRLDRWILSRLANMVGEVNHGLQTGDLHVSVAALKTFIYYEFCDIYLESSKTVLQSANGETAITVCSILLACLDVSTNALSPFMPFLCEALYHRMPSCSHDTIMQSPFPQKAKWDKWRDEAMEEEMKVVLEVVSSIRRLKQEYLSSPSKQKPLITVVSRKIPSLSNYTHVIQSLAGCSKLTITAETPDEQRSNVRSGTIIDYNCTVYLDNGEVASAEDAARALAKRQKLSKELEKLVKITSAEGYKVKASPDVKQAHQDKILALKDELNRFGDLR